MLPFCNLPFPEPSVSLLSWGLSSGSCTAGAEEWLGVSGARSCGAGPLGSCRARHMTGHDPQHPFTFWLSPVSSHLIAMPPKAPSLLPEMASQSQDPLSSLPQTQFPPPPGLITDSPQALHLLASLPPLSPTPSCTVP